MREKGVDDDENDVDYYEDGDGSNEQDCVYDEDDDVRGIQANNVHPPKNYFFTFQLLNIYKYFFLTQFFFDINNYMKLKKLK